MHGIRISELGEPGVMRWTELDPLTPGPGELLVQVAAAGVNYIDTYHRTGLYPMSLPFTPGLEGAGVIVAVGEGVHRQPGDRVAWTNAVGSYAEQVIVPEAHAVPVPEGIDLETAAAAMLQGMTAHYLAYDTFPLQSGQRCLIHAGAGGVGLLLIQMAKDIGAEVFTTVSTEQKAELATGAGADHVIRYDKWDFGDQIERFGGPRCLDVIYDGVGRATFARGLKLLRKRGMLVLFGQSSGPVEPVDLGTLARNGSLYVTRPTLFDYIPDRAALETRAGVVLSSIAAGELDIRIGHRWRLAEAGEAHRALEARATSGKVLLIPG
jgi:NADPH2:quinone reductase